MVRIIRKAYDPPIRVPTPIHGTSRAKQAFKQECDINNILKRYEKTGLVTHLARHGGRYEELPSDVDFQTALNTLMKAEEAFASLPAKIRRRFDNDPAAFLAFVQDPRNQDEMIELGLATRRPDPPAEQAPAEPAGAAASGGQA